MTDEKNKLRISTKINSRLRHHGLKALPSSGDGSFFFSILQSPIPSTSMPGTSNAGHGMSLWQGLLQDQAWPRTHPLHAREFKSSIESHQSNISQAARPCWFLENDGKYGNDENEKIFLKNCETLVFFNHFVECTKGSHHGPPFRPARQLSRPSPGGGIRSHNWWWTKYLP